jgi:hypothetical protein
MANTTNYNWETPDDTDLVKDGAAAIRTLGSSIDTTTKALNPSTTLGDIEYRSATANTNTRLAVGTTGQVLTVAGGVPSWATPTTGDIEGVTAGTGISGGGTSGTVTITNSMATAIDAKGDLIVGTGADTFSRLAVGTNTYILTADSAEATGLKWAAPAGGGGKVLQVIQDTQTSATTSSSSTYADTGLSVSITPSSATSKVLVLVNGTCGRSNANSSQGIGLKLVRNSTDIQQIHELNTYTGGSLRFETTFSAAYLDSPATTSATTYKIQLAAYANAASVWVNDWGVSTIIVMEIGA